MKHIATLCIASALILGNHQGHLALIENGTPVETYPLQLRLLPPADQAALQDGIPVENTKHLAELLQDYLS